MLIGRRSPELENLISRLMHADEAFDSHSSISARYKSDRQLLKHFRKVYSKEEFLVRSRSEIEEGTAVLVQEPRYPVASKPRIGLVQKAEGIVVNASEEKVLVNWGCNVRTIVDDNELLVYGRKKTLLRAEKSYPQTRGDRFNLRKNDLVKYIGDDYALWRYHCPNEGIWGKVVGRDDSDRTKVRLNENVIIHSYRDCLKIWVRNNIDFEKIYREVFA